jgi:hypothetical protein
VQHSGPVIKWNDRKYMSYLSLLNCWVPVVIKRGNGNRSLYVCHNQYMGRCKKCQLLQMYLVQAKRMKKWSMTLFRSLLSATVPISMNVKKVKCSRYRPGYCPEDG